MRGVWGAEALPPTCHVPDVDGLGRALQTLQGLGWMHRPVLARLWTDAADTALPLAEVRRLSEKLTTVPGNFKVHQLVEKVIADRAAMGRGEINVDWGMGEHLAYASLVASGYGVRLSGEDCGRGTFVHRHAVLHDQNREKWDTGTYVPLENVADGQAPFVVIDSLLSEEAVLGFEYGYSVGNPDAVVLWEAQFGDFFNGAVDIYIRADHNQAAVDSIRRGSSSTFASNSPAGVTRRRWPKPMLPPWQLRAMRSCAPYRPSPR